MSKRDALVEQARIALDADPITETLWQGAAPLKGRAVARYGFRTLVLCAYENQPPSSSFPGVKVLRVPLDDSLRVLTSAEQHDIIETAGAMARRMRYSPVLCTCAAGINRSGLLSAVALLLASSAPADKIIEHVRSRRPGALSNPNFVAFVRALDG
jgi:protein-tyrosine phosphatase